QKYLDDWPSRFQRVAVLQHKGANLAPWNLANYTIRANGDRVLVDEDPLIFFHFHRLRQIEGWVYDPRLVDYKTKASTVVRRNIYNRTSGCWPRRHSTCPRPYGETGSAEALEIR